MARSSEDVAGRPLWRPPAPAEHGPLPARAWGAPQGARSPPSAAVFLGRGLRVITSYRLGGLDASCGRGREFPPTAWF